ncbi:FYVE, RhoGEF and PH domain-containing protein 3-like [Copidosoma floridanum]|uniref:FYVE, RhoGEF and PH domain-containing protein 3-like n=1 Tax=Copidosoma floridanum TaxID=29053 RepID=UPI0006C991B9|nr:FYVE, RhoGEF and PH domain-containing protein 3-like [Copidosoma floridanum]
MDSPRTPKASSLSAELKDIIDKRNMLTTRSRMKVLSALDDITRQYIEEKEQSLRAQTIQEILTSEVAYLRQLEIIKEYFMTPLLKRRLLSQSSYTTLFENIETLYNVNGELLNELRQNPENVAQAFRKLAPFFKLYSVYAYNYKRALVLLQEIQQNDLTTMEFISSQETRPEVNSKLSSLLIAPIQRVPRYRLLLKEVLRHTTPRQKDYNDLQASLVEIEKVASHINALVAEYEDAQKLLELQKHISGRINLIKPGRKLIRQGPLMRVSRRGNSSFRRHFILLSDTLLYCKGSPEDSLTVCCLLPLNKCKVERVLSNGLFKVVCMHETLLVYSETGDSEAWIEDLQGAVKKYIECRQTLRKDSSSRVPMRKAKQFQTENNIKQRRRGKRPLSSCDPATESNNSDIIYINRDTESEGTSGGSNFFQALKRYKKSSSNELECTVNGKLKNWIDTAEKKTGSMENLNTFFHQTKRHEKHQCQNDSTGENNRMVSKENRRVTVNESDNSENMPLLSLKTVSHIFTKIGNTFKELFNRI